MWHAIRKLQWHRSIHARIDKGAPGAGASMAAMLIFSIRSHTTSLLAFRRETEKPYRVCVCHPSCCQKKRFRGEVIETCEARPHCVRVLTVCGTTVFFF